MLTNLAVHFGREHQSSAACCHSPSSSSCSSPSSSSLPPLIPFLASMLQSSSSLHTSNVFDGNITPGFGSGAILLKGAEWSRTYFTFIELYYYDWLSNHRQLLEQHSQYQQMESSLWLHHLWHQTFSTTGLVSPSSAEPGSEQNNNHFNLLNILSNQWK